jgi:hypothetical protein
VRTWRDDFADPYIASRIALGVGSRAVRGKSRRMAARIALGVVAVLRAALIYGEGAELATRRLAQPAWRLRRLPAPSGSRRVSHP